MPSSNNAVGLSNVSVASFRLVTKNLGIDEKMSRELT